MGFPSCHLEEPKAGLQVRQPHLLPWAVRIDQTHRCGKATSRAPPWFYIKPGFTDTTRTSQNTREETNKIERLGV